MNISHEKFLCKFLKKLNTIKSKKDLAEELSAGLLGVLGAKYCSIYMINLETNRVALSKTRTASDLPEAIEKKADEISELGKDLFANSYDTVEILDFFYQISKENVIISPIMSREDLVGYVMLISDNKDFNSKYKSFTDIIMENFNSRLDVIMLEEELDKTNKQKIQFLASISHEYKTPLNSIIGFSDILKSKITAPSEYKYIDNISKSSRFLLSLIQDILDMARAEFGKLELNYEEFRPKDVIEDIILSFDEQIKSKNINFSYTLMDVELSADIRRFKQLIYNLISNALKFNKINGTITLVSYTDEGGNFIFEIKDTGDGIRKKDYEQIFSFFSQVNRNQFKRQQGSGVGLALCKMIVNAHNGEIGFKSRLNYGSTFWFKLPNDRNKINY